MARFLQCESSLYAETVRKPVAEVTHTDAHSCASNWAWYAPWGVLGTSEVFMAIGLTVGEFYGILYGATSRIRSSEDTERRLVELMLEMARLKSGAFADVGGQLVSGALQFIAYGLAVRPTLGPTVLECGIFEVAAAHLDALGSPADWASSSNIAGGSLSTLTYVFKCFAGKARRPDLSAFVASGLFDQCIEVVSCFATPGVFRPDGASPLAIYSALAYLRNCRVHPGCEAKIRSIGPALAFCLENNLDVAAQAGLTTQGCAASLCCGVFGRDEGGSEFSFTQQHIDILVTRWSQTVRAEGFSVNTKPAADSIMACELCVSDFHKPLLLPNAAFIPYVVDALLPDPSIREQGCRKSSRSGVSVTIVKRWRSLQRMVSRAKLCCAMGRWCRRWRRR